MKLVGVHISYWVLPIISGLVWLGMLLGLLIHWVVNTDREHYPSMADNQTIAYISDIGAAELKPLFIAGCCVAAALLDLSFGADRWLRHKGRLIPNLSVGERVLMALTILFAVVGTIGLVLLSVFDTAHYQKLHDIFLLLFIAGYLLSAVFVCWEYQRLGKKWREHQILRISFWVKLVFVVTELLLAIGFVASNWSKHWNVAAIFEWIIAFVFSFYVFSFAIDLWPAIYTKPRGARYNKPSTEEIERGEGARHGSQETGYTSNDAPRIPDNF